MFDYRQRRLARTNAFNAVMLIPTGVDCAIGGHAGDATPAARLLANVCDQLVLHPNVVNASDVNEQTENSLYVEGSIICRLLMGTVGLRKVRQNRVLLVTEDRHDAPNVVDQTINCAEGARATLGMDISDVVVLEKELFMQTGVSDSGRVTGRVERLGHLLDMLARPARHVRCGRPGDADHAAHRHGRAAPRRTLAKAARTRGAASRRSSRTWSRRCSTCRRPTRPR